MRQSNAYVIGFTAIVTIVLGGVLAFTSESLKPEQKRQVELDTKKKILSTVVNISDDMTPDQVLSLYDERVVSFVVDPSGKLAEAKSDQPLPTAEKVDVGKQFKEDPKERLLPVFAVRDEVDPSKFEAYIIRVYGNGLWNSIWGFVALDSDMNTVKGAIFDHAGETPGLGARITDPDVQDRFVGKKIFSEDFQKVISIEVLKGEGKDPESLNAHQVDGLSGASMTTSGVNKMLKEYFDLYEPFLNSVREKGIESYLEKK